MPKAYVNRININYNVTGQGEPLILVSGFGLTEGGWYWQTRAFKKHYKIVTFDNRGVGKTDKPSGPYSIKMMTDDTVGLMNHLGIDKAHILGFTMGGMIAQELAINHSERVRKLILASTSAAYLERGGPPSEMWKELESGKGPSGAGIAELASYLASMSFNKMRYRMIFVPLTRIRVMLLGTKGFTEQLDAVLRYDAVDRLHVIQAPTLVITGTRDRDTDYGHSDMLAEAIPNAKLVKVEGGSHFLFMEMRGRFNKEVLDFLKAS